MAFPKISTLLTFWTKNNFVFVGKILEHFLVIKQRFWWPRWRHTQATRTAAGAQHNTAVQHSSHRHHPKAQPNYSRLLDVGWIRSKPGLQYSHILANSGARVLGAIPRSWGPVEGDPGTRRGKYFPLAYWLASYTGLAQIEHREIKTTSKERWCRNINRQARDEK